MRLKFSQMLSAMGLTLIILIISEILTSTLLPFMGWKDYRLGLNVIIILFLAIRIKSSWLPWMILVLELFHSAFSIEGWALGTVCGLTMMMIVNYLKEMIQLSSPVATMVVSQVFQLVWNVTCALIICLKLSSFERFGMVFWQLFPSSVLMSLLSPLIFALLEFVWGRALDGQVQGVEI